tara:strand:- start:268 stop:384 length:117 start_codon:yes stop_codon:yes gene_type:complete
MGKILAKNFENVPAEAERIMIVLFSALFMYDCSYFEEI